MKRPFILVRNIAVLPTIIMSIFSVSLLLVSNNLFIISIESRRLYVAILFFIILAINLSNLKNTKKKITCIITILVGFGIYFQISSIFYLLIGYNFLCFILYSFFPDDFYRRCNLAILIYALFYFSYQSSPFIFYALDYFSIVLSQTFSSLFLFIPHKLGPSASGLHVIIPFIIFFLMIFKKNSRNISIFTLSIIGIWIIFQASGRILLSAFGQVTFQILILPLIFIVFLFLQPEEKEYQSNKKLLPVVSFFILLIVVIFFSTAFDISAQKNKKVLFFEDGFFDLKIPTFEKFGALEGGLFGMLPRYLAMHGYTSSTLKGDIQEKDLHDIGIFVVTNPQKEWKDEELNIIWNYVSNGGSLLVMGDHTNIMGTQPILNKLLKPVHIKFNFDSGFPCRGEWKYCLEPRLHATTSYAKNYHDMTISVGATLSVKYPSIPVVIGKHGFSDFGNYFNKQGAYLGNYSYELGEKLGDVILVAANNYGEGKVLVFGDTSSFQNGALSTSVPNFVFQIFEWLSQKKGNTQNQIFHFLFIILLFLSVYFFQRNASQLFILLAICVFGTTLFYSQSVTMKNYKFDHATGNIFWVSISHNERLALFPFKRNSTGAIFGNALRNGYITYLMKKFDSEILMKGKVFLSVAPSKAFNNKEIVQLKEFMQQGGAVIISTGHNDKGGSTPLLNAFDLDIAGTPLGPVPIVKDKNSSKNDVQFVSAWPIVDISSGKEQNLLKVRIQRKDTIYVEGKTIVKEGAEREYISVRNDIEILYKHKAYAIVIYKKVGQGYLVVIADSLFLGEKNIEDLKSYNKGNILFLKSIFDRIKGDI